MNWILNKLSLPTHTQTHTHIYIYEIELNFEKFARKDSYL